MDELENLANRADAFEGEQQQASDYSKPEPETLQAVDPLVAAGNMAESLIKVAEGAVKLFGDSRIAFGAAEIQSGRDSIAPVLDKYGLVLGGSGRLPFEEEISAGFYVGGLWRRVIRSIKALRERDKAEIKAKEQAGQHGQERKYESEKQARAVSGAVGVRQEPDVNQGGGNPQSGGEGDSVGQQQGSSGE